MEVSYLQLEYSIGRRKETKSVSLHIVLVRIKINVLNALKSVLAKDLDNDRDQLVHSPIRPL